MTSYRGEFHPGHPQFPEGSQASARILTGPVDVSSSDIIYSAEDNEAIDIFHRKSGQSIPSSSLQLISMFTVFQLGLRGILYDEPNLNILSYSPQCRWGPVQ